MRQWQRPPCSPKLRSLPNALQRQVSLLLLPSYTAVLPRETKLSAIGSIYNVPVEDNLTIDGPTGKQEGPRLLTSATLQVAVPWV